MFNWVVQPPSLLGSPCRYFSLYIFWLRAGPLRKASGRGHQTRERHGAHWWYCRLCRILRGWMGGPVLHFRMNNYWGCQRWLEDMVDVSYLKTWSYCRLFWIWTHLPRNRWNLKAKLLFEEKFGVLENIIFRFYVELQVYEPAASIYYRQIPNFIRKSPIFQTNWVFVRKHLTMKFDAQTSVVTLYWFFTDVLVRKQ